MRDFQSIANKSKSKPGLCYWVKEWTNCLKECCVIHPNCKGHFQWVFIVKTILPCPLIDIIRDTLMEHRDF